MFVNINIVVIGASGAPHDNFHIPVAIQVGDRQTPHFTGHGTSRPHGAAFMVKDVDIAAAMSGDNFQVPVSIKVGHDHAGPHPAAVRVHTPLQRSVNTIDNKKGVSSPDYFHIPVAVQVRHGRRGIPPSLTP